MVDSDDDDQANNQRHRRSVSVSDIQEYYKHMAGAPPNYGAPPVYGGSLASYGNMVQPMQASAAYYNAPMMASPMFEAAAYYNQAMAMSPMYCNYGGPAPSLYMGGTTGVGDPGEIKVTEAELERIKKERALEMLMKGLVLFLNAVLAVSVLPIDFT